MTDNEPNLQYPGLPDDTPAFEQTPLTRDVNISPLDV
jgi:hypothetical protein